MTDKIYTYETDMIALPTLKSILGEVPNPDPDDKHRKYRSGREEKPETDARNMVARLINHLKNSEK